jgi:hypothetical protein
MSDELPQGWAATTLGQICSKPQYGWTCRAAKTGEIKYVRTTDISDGAIDWATVPYCEEGPEDVEKYRVTANDILVSRAGSVGVSLRIADVPYDAVFASYLIRFKPLNGISPKYVEFFLKSDSYWRSISEFSAGIAVPNVNATKLASLELPLSPSAEQRRIVAKLEILLDKVDASQQRLTKIPVLLKRFRQSVLAAASPPIGARRTGLCWTRVGVMPSFATSARASRTATICHRRNKQTASLSLRSETSVPDDWIFHKRDSFPKVTLRISNPRGYQGAVTLSTRS